MTFRKLHNRVILIIGLLFIFNLSCKRNIEPKTPTNDKLIISYLGDERIFHQDYWGMESTYWIFLPLVKNVGDERGEIQPVLAESWTHSDDYRTWTVKLRKDIYWHDGVQMTAKDVKFSIDLRKVVSGIEGNYSCELIDDFNFQITTIKPISYLDTWNVYYPKHLLENLDPDNYYDWDFWIEPVGNGPYRFVRNVPKTMVEVEVNPNYFGKQPKIKSAILKFSNTPSLQELLSGNVDALTYASRDFLFKIEGDKRFKSYHWWGSWTESILWNHNNPLFKEALVRKALTLAINRVELAEVLNYPDNIPISDVLSTRSQRQNSDLPKPLYFDPEKAIQLLNKSGWNDTNNDGILDKNGVDFSFTATIQEQNKLMATYIQNNLKKIHIRMDIETIEGNIIRQKLEENDFDAIITRFPNSERRVSNIKTFFNKNSQIGYYNRELDSLFNVIENTGDKNEINRLYKQLVPIFERDIPVTFIVPQVQTHIVRSEIKGLSNLFNADPVWSLESLWIE
jgi:peptide/nickel transport system substrate-binding protein